MTKIKLNEGSIGTYIEKIWVNSYFVRYSNNKVANCTIGVIQEIRYYKSKNNQICELLVNFDYPANISPDDFEPVKLTTKILISLGFDRWNSFLHGGKPTFSFKIGSENCKKVVVEVKESSFVLFDNMTREHIAINCLNELAFHIPAVKLNFERLIGKSVIDFSFANLDN